MADIDGSGGGGSSIDSATNDGENSQEVFDIHAHQINMKKMDYIRSFMGIVSGCVAGVLGLTGLAGLGEFHLGGGVLSDAIYYIRTVATNKGTSFFFILIWINVVSILPTLPISF